jgi:hypothetical protein
MMTTLLTNAFPEGDGKTFAYLCDNLQYKRVAGFLLDDNTVIDAACKLAGRVPRPTPFTIPAEAEKDVAAVAAYEDAQSHLYASLKAAQAGSAEELATMCKDAGAEKQKADLEALQLNAECVRGSICAVREPLSAEEGKEQLKKWASTSFATALVHSSGAAGYSKKLCEKLDVKRMDAVGLDGKLVKNTACSA